MRVRYSSLFSALLLWACSAENKSDLFDDADGGITGITSSDGSSGGSTSESSADGTSSGTGGSGAASSSSDSSSGGSSSGGTSGNGGDSSSGGTPGNSGGNGGDSSSGGASSDSGGSSSGGTSGSGGDSSSGGTSGAGGGSGGTSSGGSGGEKTTTGEAGNNGGPYTVQVELEKGDDCSVVRCPEEAPYPVACDIVFTEPGLDSSACVAVESEGRVFIRAGLTCAGTSVDSGTITCSEEPPDEPLGPETCIIHNKDDLSIVEGRCNCPGNVPGCMVRP